MSEVSIITNDEIMETTQLVFDRYYTELKRQLRRGEIPTEEVEQYCTEILSKVYQALQTQRVAATSYELDACAIPIINEELRKILVPLHLNGYRNLRENPITEKESSVESIVDNEAVTVAIQQDEVTEVEKSEVTEVKKEAVQVVSNGEVQVYPETAENELNPELRAEIRRILQQEFQLEPAQVKPVVVVVNVTAPQMVAQQDVAAQAEAVQDAAVQTEEAQDVAAQTMLQQETTIQVMAEEEAAATSNIAVDNSSAMQNETDMEPLPELDLDVEALVRECTKIEKEEEKEKNRYLWLWIPIVTLLLVLLWLTIGMLMGYDIIPEFDLGYEWFNKTLFELF